jgi:hypothetical protein
MNQSLASRSLRVFADQPRSSQSNPFKAYRPNSTSRRSWCRDHKTS